MAVEGVAHLGPQSIARAQAARLETEGASGFQAFVPDAVDDSRERRNHLEALFAGVTCAGKVNPIMARIGHGVEFEQPHLILLQVAGLDYVGAGEGTAGNTSVDELLYARPLQCNRSKKVRCISEVDPGGLRTRGNSALDPLDIRVDARRVYDRQVLSIGDPVDVQVVDHSPALVAHERVLAPAWLEFAQVVGQYLVEKCLRGRAADQELAHVRDVENAGRAAHGLMFLHDAGVIHRHFPAAELDEFGAQFLVRGEKRGAS